MYVRISIKEINTAQNRVLVNISDGGNAEVDMICNIREPEI